MSRYFRSYVSFLGLAFCLGIFASPHAVEALEVGMVNFASTANGGSAVSNGSNPDGAIDGILGNGPSSSAKWTNRVGGVWTGTLSTSAASEQVSEIRIYDRSCCASYAPYTVDLLDASNTVLYTDSTSTTAQRPASFAVPNVEGATQVRVSHTGTITDDSYVGEIEVIGFNGQVAGVNTLGTQVLDSTITGSTTPGNLSNANVIQLTATETNSPVRADFVEFRVFDTGGATNLALQSNGGSAFQRVDDKTGFGVQTLMAVGTNSSGSNKLNDNNTENFSDSVNEAGDYFAIGLASNSTISSVQLENRASCCGGQGNMELSVYSDAARTNLIYDEAVFVSRTASDLTSLPFNLGGKAESTLLTGRTYTMEIDGSTQMSDLFSVRPLQSTVTQLNVAGDLEVKLIAGTLTAGQTYQLFDADLFSGSFDSILLPSLGDNLVWNLGNLLVNGTLSVSSVPEPTTLSILGIACLGLLLSVRRNRFSRPGV